MSDRPTFFVAATPAQVKNLKRLAEADGSSLGAVGRRALALGLAQLEKGLVADHGSRP